MSEPWLWRPMCGDIEEAVAGMKLFESKEEMMQFVYKRYKRNEGDLVVELYSDKGDDRIKWHKTYLICDTKTGYAAGGYCTNDWDKDWPINYIDFRHSDLPVSEENILFGEVRIIKQMEGK